MSFESMTPVEIIVDLLTKPSAEPEFVLGDVLVPEGCFEIFVNGQHFFVTVSPGKTQPLFRVMQTTETGEEFWAFEGSEDACDAWIDENASGYEESSFFIERI